MKQVRTSLALLCIVLFSTLLAAQAEDPSLLTLERIITRGEFTPEGFGPARWLEDGSGYTTLERSEQKTGGQDIVQYDPATGERKILVPSERLIPPGSSTPLTVDGYDWSPDGKRLLLFTNSKRVWRKNTRGDYWVLDLLSGKLHKLGGDAEPSSLMFAKFSPDSRRVGYVCKNNIFVENLGDHSVIQLTTDGSRTLINGTFDWVYEEEFFLQDGFRWSPDSQSIAYWQLDSEGVREFYLINNTDDLYSRILPIPYPKAGETNSACRIGVVSAEGGKTRWLEVPGDPRNHYLARMDWAESPEEIVFQQLNRLQNTNRVMLGNAQTGAVRTILEERDSSWVDVVDDLHWLETGKTFTWVSERDGWRHVYRVSRSGEEMRLLTPGEYDVIRVEKVDDRSGWLYFIASPGDPIRRFLYRVLLQGEGKAERITPPAVGGTHTYEISPDSRWAFHTFSSFTDPPATDLVSLPNHRVVRTLAGNSALREKVAVLKKGPAGFFRVGIGEGVELDGWCIKPPDFDPSRPYPVLFHVYGEPAGLTVLDKWGGRDYLWHLMLSQQGYLVVSVDNRGTPAPRGRAWRKNIYRQIGILASQDQAKAARAILRQWPYADSSRVGIWGWSGGGSMSLNAIFRYPDLYHSAIAIAPVPDQRYYDTIYQERYMGLPKDNEEGFREGSPITYAHQLQGNLLLIHGTGDDNCHYQGTEALINALIAANKRFSMMAYPNRSHSISEGQNTTRHLFELLTWYLNKNLPPGPGSGRE